MAELITAHPDFPQPGVLFRDVFPVFRSTRAMRSLLLLLKHHVESELLLSPRSPLAAAAAASASTSSATQLARVDVVVGLDARGFLFGPMLALMLDAEFVPIRKRGKLPGRCERVSYEKEYGKDEFEIPADSIREGARVVIVDDVLATGGTMHAACDLVSRLGGDVLECIVLIELAALEGRSRVPRPLWPLFVF